MNTILVYSAIYISIVYRINAVHIHIYINKTMIVNIKIVLVVLVLTVHHHHSVYPVL